MHAKVAIIGVGSVGATCAYTFLRAGDVRNLVLIDIDEDTCQGHVDDMADGKAFSTTPYITQGAYQDARDADIIVISAGVPQEPGQDRCDLAEQNGQIISEICQKLQPIASYSNIIVITNPVDLMTYIAQQTMPEAQNRIIGTGTWLDTQRLRGYIATRTQLSLNAINAYVIGEHGDDQVAVWTHATTTAGTAPITDTAVQETISEKTRNRAYRIIRNKGATFYGIAACTYDIATTISYNHKRIVPVSTYIAQYEMCISLPTVVGKHGAERTIDITLSADEKERLTHGAKKLQKIHKQCNI